MATTKKKPRPAAKAKPKTVAGYLRALGTEQRAALERLRKLIGAAAPAAEECISYQMPAFRQHGRVFVWLGAASKHCALYGLRETVPGELAAYDSSGRGTLRFEPSRPLPAPLVKRLVKARVAGISRAR